MSELILTNSLGRTGNCMVCIMNAIKFSIDNHISKVSFNAMNWMGPRLLPNKNDSSSPIFTSYEINIDYLKDAPNDDYQKIKSYKNPLIKSLKVNFINSVDPLIKFLRKNEKYLICESYLGKKDEIKLNLSLGLFPYSIVPEIYTNTTPNKEIRNKLLISLNKKNNFENFLEFIIPKMIPCSYIENFKKFQNIASNISWPKKPKVIFTSHFLGTKTVSAFYTANKKEEGTKLIQGQHGGSYGISLFNSTQDFEFDISDLFLTWGWTILGNNKSFAMGILKPIQKLSLLNNYKDKKKLLFVIRPKERYFSSIFDSKTRGPQLLNYHNECIEAANSLREDIKKELFIRLHPKKYGWCEKERWKDKIQNVRIDEGYGPIDKAVKFSKLIVYTYNSTGCLEFMSANIPVVLFWNSKENLLTDEANIYFEKLKKVKIFHDSVESLASHINDNWNNINEWWSSEEVQNIRKEFCNKYCKINNNKVKDIKKIVKQISN